MKKVDFLKKLSDLESEISRISSDRTTLIHEFQCECPHPKRHLSSIENYYEDEFGRYRPSSTDYDYLCSRCNIIVRKVKAKLTTDQVRKLFRDKLGVHHG